ncbi:MAG: NAD(P)/FAD-dependent oxidoreductase [Sandaracinaceae bacterium]
MTVHYDAIVIGARCAGAATAMLLARRGLRVLAVDRAAYGADTLSTHALMRGGVVQLSRWGLLDRVRASGAPAIRTTTFRYGPDEATLDIEPRPHAEALYAPRRTVLDPILADEARDAGAHVWFGTRLTALELDRSGRVRGARLLREGVERRVRADLVIGADGIKSTVARLAGAPTLVAGRHRTATVFGYVEGLDLPGYYWLYGPRASSGFIPTNGGHCVFVAMPPERQREGDAEHLFASLLRETAPAAVAERALAAPRAGVLRRFAGRLGHLRRPYGPGWALVGDAGYFRDPITAHGITDALRDAELLARAVASSRTGALASYHEERDALGRELFAITERIASFDWSLDELAALHLDLSGAMRPENRRLLQLDSARHRAA